MTRLQSGAAVALALFAAVAQAQYWRYGNGHASTAAEGYANGMGNVIRSQGIYNQLTAQAAISAEEAKKLELENRLKATQTYFELRKMNREYTAAERAATTPSSKYAARPTRKKLSVSQLDPVTGQITWMPVLMDAAFASYREKMQSIFTLRAQNESGDVTYTEVRQLADAMDEILKQQINYLKPQDYIDAKKFLDALADEARYGGVDVVAVKGT